MEFSVGTGEQTDSKRHCKIQETVAQLRRGAEVRYYRQRRDNLRANDIRMVIMLRFGLLKAALLVTALAVPASAQDKKPTPLVP